MKTTVVCVVLSLLVPRLALAEGANMDLKPYLDFALEWTSYKYQGEALPKVKIDRHELVQIFAYGDYEYAQAESKGIKLPTVNAIYLPETKTIYVSKNIDLQDPANSPTLVHEMVHYLQDITGYTKSLNGHVACTESEAYDVQMLWQKEKNIRPEEMGLIYQQGLIAATRCMGSKSSAFGKSSRFSDAPQ